MLRWGLRVVGVLVVVAAAGAAWLLTRPAITMHHPDFGSDCEDLLTAETERGVDCIRVFYGTNRNVTLSGDGPGNKREVDIVEAGSEDGGALSLGRADVWLPALTSRGGTRERGETPHLKGPAPDDASELVKYVFLTRITAAGTDRFLTDLDTALIDNRSDTLLLFVHGFNVTFEAALVRAAQLSVDLSREGDYDMGVPVLFSWPSAGAVSPSKYKGDRDRSIGAAPYLEAFLDLITSNPDVDRINIIAHSMGNRVLTKALEDYASDYLSRNGREDLEFRIILVAADVDREIFDATTKVLDNLSANVTIYTSDSDKALQVSTIVNAAKRLGDTDGDKPYIRESERYQTVDATGVATDLFGLGHSYYSNNPFILGDMRCTMIDAYPDERALERLRYANTPDGLEYYRVSAAIEPGYEECSLYRDAFPISDLDQVREEDRGDPGPASSAAPPPPPPVEPVPDMSLPPVFRSFYVEGDEVDIDRLNAEFADLFARGAVASVDVSFHIDAVGDPDQRLAITKSWQEPVLRWMIDQGVSISAVESLRAVGDAEPAVISAEGIPEPRNRRIEFFIQYE